MESPKPLNPAEIVCSPSQNSKVSHAVFQLVVLLGRLSSLPRVHFLFPPLSYSFILFSFPFSLPRVSQQYEKHLLSNAFKFEIQTVHLHRFLSCLLHPLSRLSPINIIVHVSFERISYSCTFFPVTVPMHSRIRALRFDQLLEKSENPRATLVTRMADVSEMHMRLFII